MGLLDKWNKNKFSIYKSEEKTVLKLLESIGKWIEEIIKGVEDKTDLYGDHKGSWQGLERPTLSDEGMRAVVEKIQNTTETKEIQTITSNILVDKYFKIASFGKNVPKGIYKLYIEINNGNLTQYVEVHCAFSSKIENVSCKSPFIYSYSIIPLGGYRLISEIKMMKTSEGENFIAIKTSKDNYITATTRITSYSKEKILKPTFEMFEGVNVGFEKENYFSQDYAEISSGFQIHSALGFENTLTLRDNIVIYDDIVMHPESDTKYSSLRINNGSVIIENDNKYNVTLGNYIYTDKSKLRLFANRTNGKFYLQVGNGDKNSEVDNKGYFEISGWLGDQLKELILNAEVTIFNSDIRLDSRGKTNPSSIFFFSNGGYSQIQQNNTNDELEIQNSDGSINILTNSPHMAKVNGRAILSAQSVTSTTRPDNVVQGYSVYDRQIGKPIWWNGSNWVDASGNSV